MPPCRQRGFSLAELLITVAVLSIVAAVVLPNLGSADADGLNAASERTAGALRFARSEAQRTGQSVLVDLNSAPGRLRLLRQDCSLLVAPTPLVDPLSRDAFDLAIGGGATGLEVAPDFRFVGQSLGRFLFEPGGSAVASCGSAADVLGRLLGAGSGVALSLAGRRLTVAIDPLSGRVTF